MDRLKATLMEQFQKGEALKMKIIENFEKI